MLKTSFCWVEAVLTRTDPSEPSGVEYSYAGRQWWCSHSFMSNSCDPTDCCLPGSSVYAISQARILEWLPKIFELANRSAKLTIWSYTSVKWFFFLYKKLFFKKLDLSYFQKNDLNAISIQNLHKNFSIQPCN